MKFIDEASADKLRGGFYTPIKLVTECYRRIGELIGSNKSLHILEPSAGDGAFVRGAAPAVAKGYIKPPTFSCIELIAEEANECDEALRVGGVEGTVVNGSFFLWARSRPPVFDAAVGNPPFVRYQFVPISQRGDADWIFASQGRAFDGVSNLWIPFFLISLEMIRDGGAFAFVLPSELFSTKSTGLVRSELIRHICDLQIDLHQRGSFDGILQDVVVVSGVKSKQPKEQRSVKFIEHGLDGQRGWTHDIDDSKDAWTKYLLSKSELKAYEAACRLPEMHRLGEIASIGVSIVTGANDFFTVDHETLDKYDLRQWAKPLLARSVDSLGIVFFTKDHKAACKNQRKAWILGKTLPRYFLSALTIPSLPS